MSKKLPKENLKKVSGAKGAKPPLEPIVNPSGKYGPTAPIGTNQPSQKKTGSSDFMK